MGGHGGLNILPQKRWNVYNFDNREKVRLDEEAAAKEEQLKREQSRKRDTELRVEKLRQLRGLAPPPSTSSTLSTPSSSQAVVKAENTVKAKPVVVEAEAKAADSRHINLFEGIRIFDPIEIEKEVAAPRANKKMKKEEVRVVTAEDEKYRLGYGIVGKGTKLPWYMVKKRSENDKNDDSEEEEEDERRVKIAKKSSGKKSLEELREERLKREKKEKERERALLMEKSRRVGGFSSRRRFDIITL